MKSLMHIANRCAPRKIANGGGRSVGIVHSWTKATELVSGEPYFAVSEISVGDILPQIPRQGKHNSLRI
jgi:hypothetical protein